MRKQAAVSPEFSQRKSSIATKRTFFAVALKFEPNCGGGGGPKRQRPRRVAHRFELSCGGGGGPKRQRPRRVAHRFEPNCGGGGGPKRQRSRRVAHRFELSCGGGGGPKRQRSRRVAHRFELSCGGGGGPDRKTTADYLVEHTLDSKHLKKRQVKVDVNISLKNYSEHTWKQVIGVAENRVLDPKCVDLHGKKLDMTFEGDAVVIDLMEGNIFHNNFIISYSLRAEDFFTTFEVVDKIAQFIIADVFWCDVFSEQFKIILNFPDHITLNKISPFPISIASSNKVMWERESFRQNSKLKIHIEGELGI